MSFDLPMDQLKLVKAAPKRRYNPPKSRTSPLRDVVKTAAVDGEWRCYPALSTKLDVEMLDTRTGKKRMISAAEAAQKAIRAAARSLDLGADTTRQPSETAKGCQDLYWRIRPKMSKTTATETAE